MLQPTSHETTFSNILDTLKSVPNYTKFSKFFRNNNLNVFQGVLKAFKNAQNFEKHPLGAKKVFANIMGTLKLALNSIKFQNSLEMTRLVLPIARPS